MVLECIYVSLSQLISVISLRLQLKHCGKQVLDIFIAIAKSLDLVPCQHLNSLMYQLDTSAHNEQVEDKTFILSQ